MDEKQQVLIWLTTIQLELQKLELWQITPPESRAFDSVEPFCLDTMAAEEWLQWVFIPRMMALLEADLPLPSRSAISPYFEEALKHHGEAITDLLQILQSLDTLLTKDKEP